MDNNFHCIICITTYQKVPIKYKCSNIKCSERICDICYDSYIQTKQICVFCRTPLVVYPTDVIIDTQPSNLIIVWKI